MAGLGRRPWSRRRSRRSGRKVSLPLSLGKVAAATNDVVGIHVMGKDAFLIYNTYSLGQENCSPSVSALAPDTSGDDNVVIWLEHWL